MSEAPPPTPQAQPVTQATVSVYVGPPLDSIRGMVASQFHVKDAFLDPYGVPTIQVAAEPAKEKFQRLLHDLSQQHLVAAIRGSGDTLVVKVFQKPEMKPPRRWINLVLFLGTVATVFGAGLFFWAAFSEVVSPSANAYLKGAEFAGGLLAIVGLHEFGHKAAAVHHRLDATLPYFIPAPPPIVPFGTFGALISLREPPANRDQLFDLGLSGPLVGFAVTIIVGILSIRFGLPLTNGQTSQLLDQGLLVFSSWPHQPLLFILLDGLRSILRPDVAPNVVLYSQLDFATQIGALLTFLNIIPAWQLDGGHIWRAAFGTGGHRIATIFGLIFLFVTRYFGFAILLLIFMSFSRRGFAGVEPLDDVSSISNSRKAIFIVALVTLALTFSFAPF